MLRSPLPARAPSAPGSLDERGMSLRAGGNGCLPGPFAPIGLVARIEALLRRPAGTREAMPRLDPFGPDPLSHRGLRPDVRDRTCARTSSRSVATAAAGVA